MGADCSTEKICDPDKMFDFETQNKEVEKMKQQRTPRRNPHGDPKTPDDPSAWRPRETASANHARGIEQQSPAQKKQFRVQRLMVAAEEGQFLAIDQVLSEALGDRDNIVNEVDEMNDTALHKAARKGNVMACRSLLQHGAQVFRNGEGRTPYEVAVANQRTDCMSFLQLVDKIARAEDERGAVVVQSSSEPLINYEKNSDDKRGSAEVAFTDVPQQQQQPSPAEGDKPKAAWGSLPADGVAVVALYDFAGSAEPPFANDPRMEATMKQGDTFFLLRMRADGWCIVQRAARGEELYVPGNFVSMNGVEPLVIEDSPAP